MAPKRSRPKSRFSNPPQPSRRSPSAAEQSRSYDEPEQSAYVPLAYFLPVATPGEPMATEDSRKTASPRELPPFLKGTLNPGAAGFVSPVPFYSGYSAFPTYHHQGMPMGREFQSVSHQPLNIAVAELLARVAAADEKLSSVKSEKSTGQGRCCRMAFFLTTMMMALFVGATFSYYVVSGELADRDIARLNNISSIVPYSGSVGKGRGAILEDARSSTGGIQVTLPIRNFYLNPKWNGTFEDVTPQTSSGSRPSLHRCGTALCRRVTHRFKSSLNWSIAPCEDFYDFVCSSWKSRGASPSQDMVYVQEVEELLKASLLNSTQDNKTEQSEPAAKLLEMCVNETSLKSDKEKHTSQWAHLRQLLTRLGLEGWPFQSDSASRADLWRTVVLLQRHLGLPAFVRISVDRDPENETNLVIAMDEPDILIGLFGTKDIPLPNWYSAIVRVTMKLFSPYKYLAYSDKVLAFSEKLAEITSTRGERNYAEEVQMTTVHHLASYAQFLGLLFDDIISITDKTKILVKNMRYLKALKTLVHVTQNHDMLNYLGIRAVLHVSPLLFGEEFVELASVRMRQLTGVKKLKWPRWKTCIRMMEEPLSLMYQRVISKAVDHNLNLERISALLSDLKNSLVLSVSNFPWMSLQEKIRSKNILADIKLVVLREYLMSDNVDDIYESLQSSPRNDTDVDMSLLEVYQDLMRKASERKLVAIGGNSSWPPSEWKGSVFDTYPTFDWETHSVYVPAALFNISGPHSDPELLIQTPRVATRVMSTLLAGLHRSSYQHPSEPSIFDSNTTLHEAESCLKSQYRNISNSMHDRKVRSAITSTYDFLDNAALEPALNQFKKYVSDSGVVLQADVINLPLSVSQLFHIMFAADMCEGGSSEQLRQEFTENAFTQPKLRVIVPLRNTNSFAKSWRCSSKDPMNPPHKCQLWG